MPFDKFRRILPKHFCGPISDFFTKLLFIKEKKTLRLCASALIFLFVTIPPNIETRPGNVKGKAVRWGEPPGIPAILPVQLAGELVCLSA
jgi:hypothetical protein